MSNPSDENLYNPEKIKEQLIDIIIPLADRMSALREGLNGKPLLMQATNHALIDGIDIRSDGNRAHLRVVGKSLIAVEGLWAARSENCLELGMSPQEVLTELLDRKVIGGEIVKVEDKFNAIEHLQNFSKLVTELGF